MTLAYETRSVLRVRDWRQQPILADAHRPARVRQLAVPVPAGKSALAVLDDCDFTSAQTLVYLRLVSTVPGVHAWPIDSPTPEVGPDMRRFGWLFDWTWPVFTHEHGDTSDQVVDHETDGVALFHGGVFPCFQNYAEDVADPTGQHMTFSLLKDGPGPTVFCYDSNGNCVQDMSMPGSTGNRVVLAMLGPAGYYDLGVNNDGLGFSTVVYADNGDRATPPTFAFYSYPFVEGVLDLSVVPLVTPQGDGVWAANDRNLCRRNSAGALVIGWDTNINPPDGMANLAPNPTSQPATLEDGLQVIWRGKLGANGVNGPGCPVAGSPTWRRVTMIGMNASNSDPVDLQVANVFFGPPPGLWFELDPFAYLTHHPWGADSRPALGLQNPTDRAATVHIEYGITA